MSTENQATREPADDTLMAHTRYDPASHNGAVNPPVYHASTILFPTLAALRARGTAKVRYGRRGTPTAHTFQDAICDLEHAERVFLAPSGLSAIAVTLMAFAKPGAHFLIADTCYAPVRKFAASILSELNVRVSFFKPDIGRDIATLIEPETALIWMESPGSQTFEVQDVPAIVAVARQVGIATAIDNTWSGGYFFKPLDFGVDISIQAATKYIGGHSDLMLGTIAVKTPDIVTRVAEYVERFGICAGPDDIAMAMRGLRTLGVRMRQHYQSGLAMAKWLAQHDAVRQVLHPALEGTMGHAYWQRDFTGASGLFAFTVAPHAETQLAAMLDNLKYYGMGASWGGFESLLIPIDPFSSRNAHGRTNDDQYFRIHVGLEDVEDLQEDMAAGLARLVSI